MRYTDALETIKRLRASIFDRNWQIENSLDIRKQQAEKIGNLNAVNQQRIRDALDTKVKHAKEVNELSAEIRQLKDLGHDRLAEIKMLRRENTKFCQVSINQGRTIRRLESENRIRDEETIRCASRDVGQARDECSFLLGRLQRFKRAAAILDERDRQDQKWGSQRDHSLWVWNTILMEEVGELAKASMEYYDGYDAKDQEAWRKEAVQVAAVALAMLEQYPKDGCETESKDRQRLAKCAELAEQIYTGQTNLTVCELSKEILKEAKGE